MKRVPILLALLLLSTPVMAQEIPPTAKKASPDEFKAFADGKTVEVEILDAEKPITATLTWNWADETITGTAVIDGGKTVDVKVQMLFDGEKACARGKGEPTCHVIYIDDEAGKFYEIRDDGKVHAISTLKAS